MYYKQRAKIYNIEIKQVLKKAGHTQDASMKIIISYSLFISENSCAGCRSATQQQYGEEYTLLYKETN